MSANSSKDQNKKAGTIDMDAINARFEALETMISEKDELIEQLTANGDSSIVKEKKPAPKPQRAEFSHDKTKYIFKHPRVRFHSKVEGIVDLNSEQVVANSALLDEIMDSDELKRALVETVAK